MANNQEATQRTADTAAINELYERWRSAWLKVDPKLMLSTFDPEFDGLVYQSEENPEALYTYQELVAYWENALNILAGVSEWTELKKRVVFLSEDSAVIWALLQTNLILKVTPRQDLGGKLRCVLGLRKAKGKWTIAHYHESRQFLLSPDEKGIWHYGVDHTGKIVG